MIDTGDIEKLKALREAGVAAYQRDGEKVSVTFFPEAPKPRVLSAQEARAEAIAREERLEEFEQSVAFGAARGARVSPMRAVANEARAVAATRAARDAIRKEKAAGG